MPEILKPSEALALVREHLDKRRTRISQLLPIGARDIEHQRRFMQQAMMICEQTPKLLECTPTSLAGAIIDSAKVGLSLDPVLAQGYVVPFNDRRAGITRATFIPGYRGLMLLALRSDRVHAVWAALIRRGDTYQQIQGSNPQIIHEQPPVEDQDAEYLSDASIVGAYACAKLANGMVVSTPIMPRLEIEKIRDKSPGRNSMPWRDHFGEMAKKTAIRRLCKGLPLSPDDQRVVTVDSNIDEGMAPPPTDVEWEEAKGDAIADVAQLTAAAKAADRTPDDPAKGGADDAPGGASPPSSDGPAYVILRKDLDRLEKAVDDEECSEVDVASWLRHKGLANCRWETLPRAAAKELLGEVTSGALLGYAKRSAPPATDEAPKAAKPADGPAVAQEPRGLDFADDDKDEGTVDFEDAAWKAGRE